MLTKLFEVALFVALLVAQGCAHVAHQRPSEPMAIEDVCAKLTASIEASVAAVAELMSQEPTVVGAKAQLVSVKCQDRAALGQILMSATVEGNPKSVLIYIGVKMNADGSSDGDVLGAEEVEPEKEPNDI